MTLPTRIEAKISKQPDGCWLWIGSINPKGYGMAYYQKSRSAHRLVYEMLCQPIPVGLQLDHLCRVRHCVNPAHLEPVTNKENAARGLVGETTRQRMLSRGHDSYVKTRGPKFTIDEAREIKAMIVAGVPTRDLMRITGLSKNSICSMRRGKIWGHA